MKRRTRADYAALAAARPQLVPEIRQVCPEHGLVFRSDGTCGMGCRAPAPVDEDGDECPPVLCPRCGGTGVDPLRLVKAST
jgi:hypothetical protein